MLNQNHSILQRYFPGILKTLNQDTTQSLFDEIQVIQGKRGLPTLFVTSGDEKHTLHSQYNPQQEAERWAASVPVQMKGIVCLLGWGLGYHVVEWVKQHGKNTTAVVIIEPEPRFFLESLSIINLQPLMNASRVEIIIGCDPHCFHSKIMNLMEVFLACDLEIILTPLAEHYPVEVFHSVKTGIQRFYDTKHRILQHMTEMGKMCQTHIIQNIPAMTQSLFPRQIRGKFQGEPAIIVAAGPSLDINIQQLQPLQNHAWIFAVDTSARALFKHGIQPHFIVTKDPTELNARHFDELNIPIETVLVYDPQISPEILKNRSNQLLCMPNRNHALHSHLSGLKLNKEDELPLSNNVALAAFNLAVAAGCSPIIFVGLDLCFTPGSSHAEGTALRSDVEINEDSHTMKYTRGDDSDTVSLMLVEGVDGNMYHTTPNFMDALRLLEKLIAQSGVFCVDASEGGAKIAGSSIQTLQDAANQYCQSPITLSGWHTFSAPQDHTYALREDLISISAQLEYHALTAAQLLEKIEQFGMDDIRQLESFRKTIETGYQVYHVLQSALERLIVEINQPDYWNHETNTPEQLIQKYQRYFSVIKETCSHFAALYHHVGQTLAHENPVS